MNNDTVESVTPMSDLPTWREWAKETVTAHYEKAGAMIGECPVHRGWPPDVVRSFAAAVVIRPAAGVMENILYPKDSG